MKKITFVLAMLLMAATTFTQTSRRTASGTNPARENQERTTVNSGRTERQNNTSTRNTSTRNTEVKQERPAERSSNVERERSTSTQRSVESTPERNERRTYQEPTNNRDNRTREVHVERKTTVVRDNRPERVNVNRTHYDSPRQYRETRVVHHHYHKPPRSVHYRAKHYPYRSPVHVDIIWTPAMRTEYIEIYPMVRDWRYPIGYRIGSISAYYAYDYTGEVMNVYGRVTEVFYTGRTDEYILYFGAYYPYHDFSVVIPGHIARSYSRWPESYFDQQYISVTGLITVFDGKPEIVVNRHRQINTY
ncbi:MAG: hypothetical protein HC906_19875 [Bacteroidales bacterium]|nr:hypothetical protein [Bacteroidales bacterium]